MIDGVLLAVNGTLMRGLELNGNLLRAGARFVRDAKVALADGAEVLGVLGEPCLCEGRPEITAHGGWREYMSAKGS